MNFWDELKGGLAVALSLAVYIALIPVAITGGLFATKYIYCDVLELCSEIKK